MDESVVDWSIDGIGVGLILLSLAHVAADNQIGMVALAEISLPLAFGATIIAVSRWPASRSFEFETRQRGLVALGHVAGGILFGFLTSWLLFVLSLEGTLPAGAPFTLLLNGVAIGTLGGGIVTAVFLQRRRQRTELQAHTARVEDQNDRLERLASVVSHDLRNPLQVARARLELAEETGDESDFESARDALDRIDAIISDMLVLTRETQSIREKTSVNLAEVAKIAWETATASSEDIEFQVEESLEFGADEDRLVQAFENLFGNAVEHGGPSLTTVRVGALEDGFYVEDDGDGIPEEVHEDLFDWGTSTDSDGTGLGLAIVREIVNAHGWSITATESSDGGARFEITGVETN